MWYHNGRMINYDTVRGGVTVSTEPGPKTHSRLVVNSATHGDSGNYTCRASNTEEDTIYVSVSNGQCLCSWMPPFLFFCVLLFFQSFSLQSVVVDSAAAPL